MANKAIRFFELNTGAKIPSVGLGTWQAAPGVVGDAVSTAVKVGYRHIDCAQIYGNEKEIGISLKNLFDNGVVKREEIWITSKLWCTDHAPEDVPKALDRTLQDLQLDYLDLHLIHWPARMKKGSVGFKPEYLTQPDIPSIWKAMEALFDSGKSRAIGVSNFSSKKLGDLLGVARIPPSVDQVECHPSWQQQKLHAFCKSKGVHLSGYSPLGSSGTGSVKTEVLKNPVLNMVAQELGKSPAQVALVGRCKWVTVYCLRAQMRKESSKILMFLTGVFLKNCLRSFLRFIRRSYSKALGSWTRRLAHTRPLMNFGTARFESKWMS